jgi:hypothetical protein
MAGRPALGLVVAGHLKMERDMSTRVYLAAMWGRRLEMRAVADQLAAQGCEVTSRWLWEDKGGETADQATMDLADIVRSDVLVFFAQPHGSANRGGGRHFEFGYAWALGRLCLVVGGCEQIFCHLPGLIHVADAQELVANISGLVAHGK